MKTKLTFLLLLFAQLTLFAQKGSVRGFVYDKENGEPIMFCNVIIEGKSIGASTDVNGFFNITNVPSRKSYFIRYLHRLRHPTSRNHTKKTNKYLTES